MLNKVTVQGRLTADPELIETSTGRHCCKFVLAVASNYKNRNGTFDTDWIDCVAWAKMAETIARFCQKGSQIIVDGRLHTHTWQDKTNSVTRKSTDVVVEGLNFTESQKKSRAIDPDDLVDDTDVSDDGGLPF